MMKLVNRQNDICSLVRTVQAPAVILKGMGGGGGKLQPGNA